MARPFEIVGEATEGFRRHAFRKRDVAFVAENPANNARSVIVVDVRRSARERERISASRARSALRAQQCTNLVGRLSVLLRVSGESLLARLRTETLALAIRSLTSVQVPGTNLS